jgi:hypothetical protein
MLAIQCPKFMYLIWTLFTLVCFTTAERHCINPTDCPFYPIHSCYATEKGMICQNRRKLAKQFLLIQTYLHNKKRERL